MGLTVIRHLEPVFQAPVKMIGLRQVLKHLLRDVSGGGKPGDCLYGATYSHLRIATAPDKLLGLRVEFYLPDTAAPELDVMPPDRDLRAAPMGIDLTLDRLDILDRGKIE